MPQIQLADGRKLDFPEGTAQEVMDRVAKQETMPEVVPAQPGMAAPPPEGGTPAMSAIGGTPPAGPADPNGFVQGMIKEAPQTAGGIATGLAAVPVVASLPAVAAIPAMAGFVALGGAAGESYKQIGQHLSGSLAAPKTSVEAINRIGKAGLTEGGWELFGGLVAKGFGKIIAPLKNKLIKESVDAIDLFDGLIKPVVLLPAEATESRVLDLLQNVSEASLIGGSAIQDFKTKRIKFFDDFADSLIDEFGKRTDPTDLGNLFVASINNSKAVHNKAAKILYNSVKAGRAKTSTQSLKNFVKPLQKRAAKLEGIEAKNAGDDLVGAIMDLPDQLSFKEAVELRSRLISRIDEFSVLNKKAPAIGKAKRLVGLLDNAIEKSLKGTGGAGKIASTKTIEVYHGGKVLDESKGGITYFTKNKKMAKSYADMTNDGSGKGSVVSKAYISMDNPAKQDVVEKYARKIGIDPDEGTPATMFDRWINGDMVDDLVQELKDAGYDGAILEDIGYGVRVSADAYIPFNGFSTKKPLKGVSPGGEPGALEAWRTANRFYKDGQAKFNNTLLRRLVKLADDTGTGSEMIASAIFKPGHVSSVSKVKTALANDPDTWKKMQGFFMQHILQKSTDTSGDIVGKKLINNISGKPGSFGLPMLQEVFTEPQLKALTTFGKAVRLTQERQAEGAGRVLIQLTQAGALGTLLTGNLALPSATIIIAPAILSKLLLNPKVAKLLTTGLTLPANSSEAAGIMTRLIAATWRAKGDDDETE